VGKKINVFRKNDVGHLKAYLAEVVRGVVFGEAEEEADKDAAAEKAAIAQKMEEFDERVKLVGDKLEEIATLVLKKIAPDTKLTVKPDATTTALGKKGFQKNVKVSIPNVSIEGDSGIASSRAEGEGEVLTRKARFLIWRELAKWMTDEMGWVVSSGAKKFHGGTAKLWDKGGQVAFEDLRIGKGKYDVPKLSIELVPGKGGEKDANRGELAEAWMALAITKRFMNLPESEPALDDEGNITGPVPGLVTPEEVIKFLESERVVRDLNANKVTFRGEVKDAQGEVKDTINMVIELRGYSVDGLKNKEGKISDFARRDPKTKEYLKGAVNFANREVVRWALGKAEEATSLGREESAGWFVNGAKNDIDIGAIGTGAQSVTKVDLEMACGPIGDCPISKVKGNAKDIRSQLARLSLKAGEVSHFGGGAASTMSNAIGVMEEVFPGLATKGEDGWSLEGWSEAAEGAFETTNTAKRMEHINMLVNKYAAYVKTQLDNKTITADGPWIDKMVEGLLKNSVKGSVKPGKEGTKDDFSKEEGVLLVQTTDKGDFYTIDFNKLPDILGANSDFSAVVAQGGDVPYLAVYAKTIPNEKGEPVTPSGWVTPKVDPESETSFEKGAPNVLFTMRGLGRGGGQEILRLEKGPLMKTLLSVDQHERLVYRNGQMVTVDADSNPLPETLEEKVFAILKEGLKISK